ncbi:MAG: 5-formyltetrahydrofolate cyclo-ligase [Oscillospiraceae bacterium]|nr:5-formyltetrahydrofolate cyclo-ligase [Oscillospiraceae bacterium]MDY2847333.1 5-formyltetrahydrofolate cyclo-ligase [Oscillospiraceae bacterium]
MEFPKMGFDLREYKSELRNRFKTIRKEMPPDEKQKCDSAVFRRVISSAEYKRCSLLLTYVSTGIEVDTMAIIGQALADGKMVSVPRCISGTRLMDFYYISSPDDLEPGSFGVLEPRTDICRKTTEFDGALCIVPGLSFDMKGYRLGYGKGYYDRFLSAHPNMYLLGLCYCRCTVQELISGRFDKPVDSLATDKYYKTFSNTKGGAP